MYVKELNPKQRRVFNEIVDDNTVNYAFNWYVALFYTYAFCYIVPDYLRNLTVSKDRRDATFTPRHVLKSHYVVVK